MSHSYCTNLIHSVFSTKDRKPSIPEDMLEKMWAYMSGIAENHHMETLAISGITNHVHLLIAIPQTMTVASAINALKANSSRWMHERNQGFDWQKGYGAFSVSPSQLGAVKQYIRTQAEHHATHTFDEEFVSLLKKCGVPYDQNMCLDRVPHRWRSGFNWHAYPPLPRWANECRRSAAGDGVPSACVTKAVIGISPQRPDQSGHLPLRPTLSVTLRDDGI